MSLYKGEFRTQTCTEDWPWEETEAGICGHKPGNVWSHRKLEMAGRICPFSAGGLPHPHWDFCPLLWGEGTEVLLAPSCCALSWQSQDTSSPVLTPQPSPPLAVPLSFVPGQQVPLKGGCPSPPPLSPHLQGHRLPLPRGHPAPLPHSQASASAATPSSVSWFCPLT